MSTYKQRMNAFSDGRREAFAEIRKRIRQGKWNEEVRASWMKETVSARSHVRRAHPYLKGVAAYHAGYLSALKSRQGERFANDYQSGWDWYGDEDNLGVVRPARVWNHEKLKVKKTKSKKQVIALVASVLLFQMLFLAWCLRIPLGFLPVLLFAGFRIAFEIWKDLSGKRGVK